MEFIKVDCPQAGVDIMLNPTSVHYYTEEGIICVEGHDIFTVCQACKNGFIKDLGVNKKVSKKEAKKIVKDQVDSNQNGRITKKEVIDFLTKD